VTASVPSAVVLLVRLIRLMMGENCHFSDDAI
jgi:hypothetical protein